MDRGFYLAGQVPVVKIHAGYLFGKPVAAGTIGLYRLDGESWNTRRNHAEEKAEPVAKGAHDEDGNASFTLDVKSDFDDLAGDTYERYTDLAWRAIVTDASTGRSEPRKFTVRLSRDPVHIYLSESLGDEREGDVIVSTSYADGTPVACKLEFDWMDENSKATRTASITTNRFGLAKVHLRYPAVPSGADDSDRSLRVIARDPEGRVTTYDDTIRPQNEEIWLAVRRSLLRPQEPIELSVHGTRGDVIDLDVVSESAMLAHLQVRMHDRSTPVTIPADSRFHGLISIRAYKMSESVSQYDYRSERWSSRSVLYPEDRALRLGVSGIKPSYAPGAQVTAGLRVTDASRVGIGPEISFWNLNGKNPMKFKKKSKEGKAERLLLLRTPFPRIDLHLQTRPHHVGADDLLDAAAAAWTALRYRAGSAESVCNAEHDDKGLTATIYF
jgi:hypothetical protein